jgi:hypothetical protein
MGGWERGTMFQEALCNEGGGEADRSNSYARSFARIAGPKPVT